MVKGMKMSAPKKNTKDRSGLTPAKSNTSKKQGLKRLNAIMNALPKNNRAALLGNLQSLNLDVKEEAPEIKEKVKEEAIVIRELPLNALSRLDGPNLQKLFRAVDRTLWTRALKIAEPELKDYIMSQLSVRARGDLEDDLRAQGPVRLRDAQEAGVAVMQHAQKLESSGQIVGLSAQSDDPWVH